MSIKAFVYLDEYKMYSISSQIFEGLTEYIIDYAVEGKKESEEQRGPLGSGRILADIITHESSKEERKFLHDYSYTLFEKKLITDGKVVSIDTTNIHRELQSITNSSFFKVTGKLIFNDNEAITNMLSGFNTFGASLTYVNKSAEIAEKRQNFEKALEAAISKDSKTKLRKQMEEELDIEKIAQTANLHLDPEYLKHLVYLLQYGFGSQFEVQLELPYLDKTVLFSANLNRKYLKEDEKLLLRRHSRFTEKEFTIFGTVTQNERILNKSTKVEKKDPAEPRNFQNVKEALLNLISSIFDVESSFTGRLQNEIVIDPIAIYRQL